MRKVCERCGGTGFINSWSLNGTTAAVTSTPCNMCGGNGYVEDVVFRDCSHANDYTQGYVDGFNAGSKAYQELLARQSVLAVNPICFCHKCGMELGIMSTKEKAHEQKAEVATDT